MERYKNLSGDSGILAYEIESNGIKIQFMGGATYLFTNESAGANNIEIMKRLALQGKGLATYINAALRTAYASKSS